MKLVELFSGIGGFAKGLSDAGISITEHEFSEVNKHAIANYKYNYANAKHIGAVENVSRIKGADIITFGSPCQNFSLLGNQQGLGGDKSVLIGEAIRIVDEARPSIFIWENVKGAFSTNDSRDFWAVIQRFADIGGYRLQWQLCNSNWFLPQNRERIFLVGICKALGGECFPITGESRKDKINDSIRAISYTRDEKGKLIGYNYRKHFNTIHTSTGSGGNTDQYLNSYGEIRKLGIRECEALQGFERDWTRKGNYDGEVKKIPLTERRKLIGNAVTVDVVKAIGKKIIQLWN